MIEIETRGFKELIGDLRTFPKEMEEKVIQRMSQVAYDSAQRGAGRHIVSGALFQSLFNKPVSGGRMVGHDTNRAPQARYVIQGTIPHVIRPKNKQSLRWPGPNGFIFAKLVNHPGYKGDPYMDKAKDDAIAQFNTIIDGALKESL